MVGLSDFLKWIQEYNTKGLAGSIQYQPKKEKIALNFGNLSAINIQATNRRVTMVDLLKSMP